MQTNADVATMQFFSLTPSMAHNASACSVSAAPQLLLKLLGETTGGLRNIASKALSRELVTISRLGKESGEGGRGVLSVMMEILIFFIWSGAVRWCLAGKK
jgi:hypothetical protein